MAESQLSVLFVCLGNICRSTMAEGVFQSLARKAPYEELVGKIDSCGTGTFFASLISLLWDKS
jgi:low molecular weight phosphotyrosine protein phosphatase